MLAPSMLLGPETEWSAADEESFDVSLTDREVRVTARVLLDERGAPRDFATLDRFVEDPEDPKHPFVRTRWTTPIEGWQTVEGCPLPTRGRATWHLPSGPFPYADFQPAPGTFATNVPPGG
jgi:hypothetical protein